MSNEDFGVPERPERKGEDAWSEANIRRGFEPEHKEPEWKVQTGGIGFAPSEEWGTVHKSNVPMNWPQAVSSIVLAVCVTVILVTLFMVLWGPW